MVELGCPNRGLALLGFRSRAPGSSPRRCSSEDGAGLTGCFVRGILWRMCGRAGTGSSAGTSQVHLGVLLKSWKRRGNGDQSTQQNQRDRISNSNVKIKLLLG